MLFSLRSVDDSLWINYKQIKAVFLPILTVQPQRLIDQITDRLTDPPTQWLSFPSCVDYPWWRLFDLVVDTFPFASLWWWFPIVLNGRLSFPWFHSSLSLPPIVGCVRFPPFENMQSVSFSPERWRWFFDWDHFAGLSDDLDCNDDLIDFWLFVRPVILTLWLLSSIANKWALHHYAEQLYHSNTQRIKVRMET